MNNGKEKDFSSHLLVLRAKSLLSKEPKNGHVIWNFMVSNVRSGRIILIECMVLLIWHYNTEACIFCDTYVGFLVLKGLR